jgi:hypothetical protein
VIVINTIRLSFNEKHYLARDFISLTAMISMETVYCGKNCWWIICWLNNVNCTQAQRPINLKKMSHYLFRANLVVLWSTGRIKVLKNSFERISAFYDFILVFKLFSVMHITKKFHTCWKWFLIIYVYIFFYINCYKLLYDTYFLNCCHLFFTWYLLSAKLIHTKQQHTCH